LRAARLVFLRKIAATTASFDKRQIRIFPYRRQDRRSKWIGCQSITKGVRDMTTILERTVLALALIAAASTAHAQRGYIGDGGRMPETMFPGAQPPTSMPEPRMSAPIGRYPDTEAFSRDSIESQGYRVDGIARQNDGSWQAGTSSEGVPTKVTVFPDGKTMEEHE
jgi:hypothetical protein